MDTLDVMIADETLIVDGRTYKFAELTGVNANNLNHEFTVQASRYAFIAALCAKAEILYNESKLIRETVYANVELIYREELVKDTTIKVTEGLIKAYTVTDKRYADASIDENKALSDWKLLRALVDGLKQRGEMLISLGAQIRSERDFTDLHINETKERLKELRG